MCDNRDNGRLDIHYNYSILSEKVKKDTLSKRSNSVWKYFEFLPLSKKSSIVTLNEGGTPLLKADNLAKKINVKNLLIKDETRNPTGSFKDRSMTVGVSKAVEFGAKTVAIASSGNAAASLSAYSAKAKLRCFAFVLEFAPLAKIIQIGLYGANVIKVKSTEKGKDPTVKMLLDVIEENGWYPCPSFGPFNPYQVEGPKTISYEIIEQLDWEIPDWVMIPTGSGCLFTGVWKGFKDFSRIGLTDCLPKLAAIQSAGCAPLVRAFKENKGKFDIQPWKNPDTIAGGLADVFPWDGDAALSVLKNKGVAESVTNEEILEAQKLLASTEGLFAEPSGVASLAGLIKLVNTNIISRDENIILLITGSGLKDPEVIIKNKINVPIIKPNIKEFERVISKSDR
jgi:threonine synthase